MNEKITLNGLFQSVDMNRTRERFYYTEDEFQKHMDILNNKILMEKRINKINKIKNYLYICKNKK